MGGSLLFAEMENTSYIHHWHGEIDLLVLHWSLFGHPMENVQSEKVYQGSRSYVCGWGCPPSKFPWTYTAKEMCYLIEGKVKVYPDGHNDCVEFGAGDLVEFPKGMKCTWDVSEAVDKHYNFE